jgi:hypothetical protein
MRSAKVSVFRVLLTVSIKQVNTVDEILFEGKIKKYIHSVPGGKVNILGDHSIGHSKKKNLYEHVSYSKQFPR